MIPRSRCSLIGSDVGVYIFILMYYIEDIPWGVMSQTLVNPILFNAYLGSEGVSRQSNRLPRTKKMTTDRKDGQSENYGFTLVINTPPPVYDSGSKPLEVVGERTFKIKNMDYYPKTDKEIRMYCLEYIRDPFNMAKSEDIINSAQRIYDFICPKPNSVTEMSCVETGHMHQFKSLDEALNWIKNVDMSEFILNKKENNRPNDIPDLWYLREGDFLPEPVSGIFNNRGPGKTGIKLLKEAGNLFPSKEEATIASEKVREFLCSINNPWCL